MSFRSAPIVEQPIHNFACEQSENLNQKARDYLDRIHWLPLFKHGRESASRLGNLFNKGVHWLHEYKFFEKSAIPLIHNQFADQHFHSVKLLRREINHPLFSLFSCIYNDLRCQGSTARREIKETKQYVSRRLTKTPCGRQSLLKQNVMGDL